MSKISSNNYDQAVKEIKGMDAELVSRIPEKINANDANHYHVALVRITDRPGQVKNDVNVNVQQYHKNGFEKIKKTFIFQGFAKLVVVHNPENNSKTTQKKVDATVADDVDSRTVANDDNTPVVDQNAGKRHQIDPVEALEQQYQNAIGGNKPELIDFAERHDIDLSEATNNDLRVEAINKWYNAKMDELSKK